MSIRKRTWEIVEAERPGDVAGRVFAVFILALIFLNVIAVIVGSVQSIQERWGHYLYVFEIASLIVFTVEHVVRLWSCTADPRFNRPIRGRLRFALHLMPLIDLLVIAPLFLPFVGIDLRSLRVFRLLRVLRVVRVGRYYSSLKLVKHVLLSKKEELVLASSLLGLLLVVSSTLLYYCENAAQPGVFSSIPATMWWSVTTLTSVGYGDIYPITAMGKFFASIVSILGIGMFALPTGIIGAGFVEAVQVHKEPRRTCPHCGKEIR